MDINQITQAIQKAVQKANITAVQTVLSDIKEKNNIDDLREQIQHLPSDIYNHRIKINQYKSHQRSLFREIKDREIILKSLENDLLLMITAETNPDTGKPRYTNEKARQAELLNRKKNDPEYQAQESQLRETKDRADDLENQIAMTEAELDRLQNQFIAVRKQLELGIREMSLAAAAISSASLNPLQFAAQNTGFNEGWDE